MNEFNVRNDEILYHTTNDIAALVREYGNLQETALYVKASELTYDGQCAAKLIGELFKTARQAAAKARKANKYGKTYKGSYWYAKSMSAKKLLTAVVNSVMEY